MTGPCKHCPLSTLQLCIPATPLIGDWTLDNEAPRHSHNYRGANILIGDKLPSKLSKHVWWGSKLVKTRASILEGSKVVTFITTKTDCNVCGMNLCVQMVSNLTFLFCAAAFWLGITFKWPAWLSRALWAPEGRCLWLGWTPGGSLVSPWLLISSLRIRIEMISAEILLRVSWLWGCVKCFVAMTWHTRKFYW